MHKNEICVRSNDAAAIPCARCARAAAEMGANDRTGTGDWGITRTATYKHAYKPKCAFFTKNKKHHASQLNAKRVV